MTILGNPPANTLLRVLIYGDSQRKKTWWAASAGEAGFNCLVLNGDKPATIYRQLSPAAQSRIRIVNCLSDNYNFSNLIAGLLKYRKFFWDIDDSKKAVMGMEKKTHSHFQINLDKLTNNDVLILDSWTGLVNGTVRRLSVDLNVDLSEVSKIEWNLYGPSGLFLNWVLGELGQLPCHVIVVAHADTWEKQKKDSKGKLTSE